MKKDRIAPEVPQAYAAPFLALDLFCKDFPLESLVLLAWSVDLPSIKFGSPLLCSFFVPFKGISLMTGETKFDEAFTLPDFFASLVT